MGLFQGKKEILVGTTYAYSCLLCFDSPVWWGNGSNPLHLLLILIDDKEKNAK